MNSGPAPNETAASNIVKEAAGPSQATSSGRWGTVSSAIDAPADLEGLGNAYVCTIDDWLQATSTKGLISTNSFHKLDRLTEEDDMDYLTIGSPVESMSRGLQTPVNPWFRRSAI